MKLITDDKLVNIPIKDNGEVLVNIKVFCPKIIIRLWTYIKKEGKEMCNDACLVRKSIAEKIHYAQSLLPFWYIFILRCGHRALSIQKKRYETIYQQIAKQNPGRNEKRVKEETSKRIAPPDIIPPHSTWGAIDLSILWPDGKQLEMWTRLGQFNEKTYTDSKKISEKAKKNRKLLSSVMSKAGFVNYPTERWHWSYGDRYWAAYLKKKYSIYDWI